MTNFLEAFSIFNQIKALIGQGKKVKMGDTILPDFPRSQSEQWETLDGYISYQLTGKIRERSYDCCDLEIVEVNQSTFSYKVIGIK